MSKLELQQSARWRRPAPFHPAISICQDGLVCGAGSTLVRMSTAGSGAHRLLVEDDAARLSAMLSAAFGRHVSAAEVVPHVSAAAEHWARGDKAVANFRLIFARLPRLRGSADADRLSLAEYVLDQGLSPDALMKELGFADSDDLRKYREDQPRVPGGFGDQSGRWTSDPELTPSRDKPTRVAEELPQQDEKEYETRHLEGTTSRQEDIEHGRGGLLDTPGLPRGIGAGPYAGKSIPAGPNSRATIAQRNEVDALGHEYGCHTCGSMDPGTTNGRFRCDHQPSTALCDDDTPQYYYPHCATCSDRQGGLISQYKKRKQANE